MKTTKLTSLCTMFCAGSLLAMQQDHSNTQHNVWGNSSSSSQYSLWRCINSTFQLLVNNNNSSKSQQIQICKNNSAFQPSSVSNNNSFSQQSLLNNNGSYPMSMQIRQNPLVHLENAVKNNSISGAKSALKRGASLHHMDKFGMTLLYHAISRGYFDMVKFLVAQGIDINAQSKIKGISVAPIHAAIKFKQPKILEYLIPDVRAVRINNLSLIEFAQLTKDKIIIDVIENWLDNTYGNIDNAILYRAELRKTNKEYNLKDLTELLDDFQALVSNRPAPFITRAIECNDLDAAQLMLERNADINETESAMYIGNPEIYIEKATSLIIATLLGHTECVKFLLEKGADSTRKDNFGFCALEYALQDNKAEIARMLEQHQQ